MGNFSEYLCLGGLCICLIVLAVICLDYSSFKNSFQFYKQQQEIRINNIWKRIKNHENRLMRIGSCRQDGYQTPGWEDDEHLTQLKDEKDVR